MPTNRKIAEVEELSELFSNSEIILEFVDRHDEMVKKLGTFI